MKKPQILLLILIVNLFSATFTQQRKLVGNLKLKNTSACGEFYRFAGQSPYSPKLIFYTSAGDEAKTWMNIDGKDVRLKFVSKTAPTKTDAEGGELIGSRTTDFFSALGITVKLTFTISRLCAADDPHYESIGSTAIFKVRKGKRRRAVKAVGIFGC